MVKCAKCSKAVTKKGPGVQCARCSKWYHGTCASLTTDQLSTLSSTDSVDWKCRGCVPTSNGRKKRISVILPDPEDEESDMETVNQSEQEKTLCDIRQDVRELRQSIKDIIHDELQSSLHFYSNKIDEYEERTRDYEARIKIMENQYKNIVNTCTNLTLKIEVLEQKINKHEQAQSWNDLEVCGITEQDNEDVKSMMVSLSQILKQKPEDIIRVNRKKKPSRQDSKQAERARLDAPIIVSLREGTRDSWIEAAKTAKINAQDIGGVGDKKVYLRESLSSMTAYLLWKSKKTLKETMICKYVWCKNGQIMARKKEGEKKIYYINSEKDIGRIGKELQKK